MYAGLATRLKIGPVIPGAAACAVAVNSMATPTSSAANSRVLLISFFMFLAFMAALLIDADFGHQTAEVFCVVGQVVKIGGVEVVSARRDWRRAASIGGTHRTRIQNHVDRF